MMSAARAAKTQVISCRVDAETASRIKAAADLRRVTTSTLARDIVIEAMATSTGTVKGRRASTLPASSAELRKLLGELGRHGNLINQGIRALNASVRAEGQGLDFSPATTTATLKAGVDRLHHALSTVEVEYMTTLRALREAVTGKIAP